MTKHHYPLSIQISTLFLILITIIGAVLVSVSYQHAQQLLISSAKEISYENSDKLEATFSENVSPVLTTLDFMAYNKFIEQNTPVMQENRWLSSVCSSKTIPTLSPCITAPMMVISPSFAPCSRLRLANGLVPPIML